MYGCEAGDAWGSPEALRGKRRDRVEAKERKKIGIVLSCREVNDYTVW